MRERKNTPQIQKIFNYKSTGLTTTLALVLGMAQTANSATKGVVFSSSMKSSSPTETAYSVTEADIEKAMKKYCIPVDQFNCQTNKLAKYNSKNQKCDCLEEGAIWFPAARECQKCAENQWTGDLQTSKGCLSCGVGVQVCDVNTGKVKKCSPGYYPKGASCERCPAGYYCPDGVNRKTCSEGQNCPGGTSTNAKCPNYTWSNNNSEYNCRRFMVRFYFSEMATKRQCYTTCRQGGEHCTESCYAAYTGKPASGMRSIYLYPGTSYRCNKHTMNNGVTRHSGEREGCFFSAGASKGKPYIVADDNNDSSKGDYFDLTACYSPDHCVIKGAYSAEVLAIGTTTFTVKGKMEDVFNAFVKDNTPLNYTDFSELKDTRVYPWDEATGARKISNIFAFE